MVAAQVKMNGAPLEQIVDVAETAYERGCGLLGRRERLYFAPAYLTSTAGARFHQDLVFCDRHGRVVAVREHVPPGRVVFCRRGHGVLRLETGAAADLLIAPGDRISFSAV